MWVRCSTPEHHMCKEGTRMGRSDVNMLTVSYEPVRSHESKPEIPQAVQPSKAQVENKLTELLRCPSCDSKLSSPEAKMGRCLSCGCKLSGEQEGSQDRKFTVGI